MSYVIVTRHQGLVEWLKQRGIEGDVIPMATPENVKDQDVIGVLPPYLACLATSVTAVDLPNLTMEQRGKDLTVSELDAAGAKLTCYEVNRREEGDLRSNGDWIEGWLNGRDGLRWYRVGAKTAVVLSPDGFFNGYADQYSIHDLFADPKTGQICAEKDALMKKGFTDGSPD